MCQNFRNDCNTTVHRQYYTTYTPYLMMCQHRRHASQDLTEMPSALVLTLVIISVVVEAFISRQRQWPR